MERTVGGRELVESNKSVVRRYFTEAFNENTAILSHLVANNIINHTAEPASRFGIEEYKEVHRASLALHPEWIVEDLIGEGDRVVCRVTLRGSVTDDPEKVSPRPSRSICVEQIHIFRLNDGKIAEHWAVKDDLGMLEQLGVIPTQ